jgi:spore maturation protein CgeB
MAHMFGCGLLTLIAAGSGFEQIYSDEDAVFYTGLEDLGPQIAWLLAHDDLARAMAERGWRKTWGVFEVGRVFAYLLDQLYRDGGAADASWPSQRWGL